MTLVKPEFTVLSIDPGNNMGIAISRIYPLQGTMEVLFSTTLVIDKVTRYDNHEIKLRRSNYERREAYLYPVLTQFMREYNVDAVIYESGYNAKSIIAYEALTFYGACIRRCAQDFDWDILIQQVAPSRVKSLIGVVGGSKDKSLIPAAIASKSDIILSEGIVLADLTEHAHDAIAIGYVVLSDFNN